MCAILSMDLSLQIIQYYSHQVSYQRDSRQIKLKSVSVNSAKVCRRKIKKLLVDGKKWTSGDLSTDIEGQDVFLWSLDYFGGQLPCSAWGLCPNLMFKHLSFPFIPQIKSQLHADLKWILKALCGEKTSIQAPSHQGDGCPWMSMRVQALPFHQHHAMCLNPCQKTEGTISRIPSSTSCFLLYSELNEAYLPLPEGETHSCFVLFTQFCVLRTVLIEPWNRYLYFCVLFLSVIFSWELFIGLFVNP